MRLVFSRNWLIAASCAILAVTTASACSNSGGAVPGGQGASQLIDKSPVATDEEIAASPTAAAIKRRGQLVIGSTKENPLLSQQNPITGLTEGFDADLGRMLAKYIIGQPNTTIINATPTTRETLLQNETVDTVLYTYSITPARAEKIGFAGPYFVSGPAIATLKTTNGITKPADLKGKKVLAAANTTGANVLKQVQPDAELITFPTSQECIQALEQGRAEAYVNDLTILASNAVLNTKLKVIGTPFGKDPYGIGIKHGDTAFKKFVNDWLKKIQASGLWQQAYQETLGTKIEGPAPAPPEIGSVPGS
ncbi:glutamate ABC transporter substrate-binding protein [Amycolatopsis sp. CA-230715]|uniref:glutamate ABC transporter substrate-binding protein n=1 Tax=Amycolatopsis sp. CA-230715 TaxID=2745196 RepID=UPI001C00CFFE|nr:glutamate ABC transporter substrate-binding protein [Amycolatopsis sp. CA-230715]QWF78598.1 ABC transporter glutamine-binding protein GlnH [Amycolatopsis sp. CA-230715]